MSRQVLGVARAVFKAQPALKSGVRNSSAYKAPASWFEPTMNELPVPQGSWQTAHEAAQRKNNKHLILGVSFFALTLVVMKTSGLIVLNATIPKLPDEN